LPPCMLLTPPLGEEQFPVPLPSVPVGGRLTQFLHHWEKFTTDVWVLCQHTWKNTSSDRSVGLHFEMGNRKVTFQNREIYHRSHSPSFLGNQEETRIKPWCRLSQRNFLYYSLSQFLWLPGNFSDLSGTTRFTNFWRSRLAWRLHHRFLLGFFRRL
jgi:hypothetical protein